MELAVDDTGTVDEDVYNDDALTGGNSVGSEDGGRRSERKNHLELKRKEEV